MLQSIPHATTIDIAIETRIADHSAAESVCTPAIAIAIATAVTSRQTQSHHLFAYAIAIIIAIEVRLV
jgi:hypothetical protein